MKRTYFVTFVARRLGALALLLVAVSFGVFALVYFAPGSPEQLLLGTRPATPDRIAAIRAEYHLDDPLMIQYGRWLVDAVQLDFGRSIRTSEPVLTGIAQRVRVTFTLGAYAAGIALVGGVGLSLLAAVRRRTSIDRAVVGMTVVALSAPAFATGILLLYVFAVVLEWFPVFGQGEGFLGRLWHLTLPALALAFTGLALVVRFTRAGLIHALDQDYVAFARMRGIGRWRILFTYGLRNALVPVITAGGLILGVMLTGAVLVEVTFALPGLGSLLVDSVAAKDIPMVQGVAMVAATVIILVNLMTDVLYMVVDPRIRYGETSS